MRVYRDKKGRSILRYSGPDGAFLKYPLKLLGVRFLELNRGIFSGSSIMFVGEFKFLQGLFITDWKLKDIECVSHLPGLRAVRLSTPLAQTLDLGGFPELTELGLDFARCAKNLQALTQLTELFVGKLEWDSLSKLNSLKALKIAEFSEPAFTTVGSVELPNLEELVLKGADNLVEWEGMSRLSALRRLLIFKAPHLASLSSLAELADLEWLLLEDCGTIDSLSHLTRLKNLRRLNLVGDTRIADGRISTLLSLQKLEQVSIPTRRGDDMTAAQINEVLRVKGVKGRS